MRGDIMRYYRGFAQKKMTLIQYVATNTICDDIKNFDRLTAEAQEKIRLETLRFTARIQSLEFAQAIYQRTMASYHSGIIDYAESDDDDFETGYSKARKLTAIENEFDEASARLNLELKEAHKLGLIIG